MAGTALAEAGGCDPTSGHSESAGERGISMVLEEAGSNLLILEPSSEERFPQAAL